MTTLTSSTPPPASCERAQDSAASWSVKAPSICQRPSRRLCTS
ncbi:hypothetical protein ACIU1J_06715 [Azospirillum doebereinerae]